MCFSSLSMLSPCSSAPCHPGVRCFDIGTDLYECGDCPEDTFGDGRVCTATDHCASDPCYPGVKCFNFPDKFKCGTCPAGLTGNGIKCTSLSIVNPCSPNPCYPGVSCVTVWSGTEALYSCGLCPDGELKEY